MLTSSMIPNSSYDTIRQSNELEIYQNWNCFQFQPNSKYDNTNSPNIALGYIDDLGLKLAI